MMAKRTESEGGELGLPTFLPTIGAILNDVRVRTEGGGLVKDSKLDNSKGDCVDLALWSSPKCRQWASSSRKREEF